MVQMREAQQASLTLPTVYLHGVAVLKTFIPLSWKVVGRKCQRFWSNWASKESQKVAAYVLSLSGRTVDRDLARAGEQRFAVCAACHGQDGQGKIEMGAPNLTDNVWLYGGSQRAVEETLRYGRNGVMPAWDEILGEDKVKILSGYILSLNQETE